MLSQKLALPLALLAAAAVSAADGSLHLTPRYLDTAPSNATSINIWGDVLGWRIVDEQLVTVIWTIDGRVTQIGTPKPQKNPTAINWLRQVAGYMDASIDTPNGFQPRTHAYLWTPGRGIVDIGTLGGPDSFPAALNALGDVAGDSSLAVGSARHAFFWRAGKLIDLGTLGDQGSSASALNDRGDVVGQSAFMYDAGQAFIWSREGGMRALGRPPEALVSGAIAINNRRQVGGRMLLRDDSVHSFFWTEQDGTLDIGTLGGNNTHAMAMNGRGQIAGVSETSSGKAHVFLWTPGRGMADLGSLSETPLWSGDRLSIQVYGMNDSGLVVGSGLVSPDVRHAFIASQAGGIVDLGSGTEGSIAVAINEFGVVAGNIGSRAVRWTPKFGW